MKKCIILANGTSPKKSVINYLQKRGYSELICADGGANIAYKLKLIPDYIIGDFDSISDEVKKFYSDKTIVKKIARQNDTDVEKCLKFAIKKKYDEVILLGATGSRLDHSFCNLGIVLKYFEKIKIKILHESSLLECYEGNIMLNTIPNEVISIYGISPKTKITSTGLKYKLNNISLPFGEKESTSNVALSKIVNLKIVAGRIFVIRDFNVMKNNDLI